MFDSFYASLKYFSEVHWTPTSLFATTAYTFGKYEVKIRLPPCHKRSDGDGIPMVCTPYRIMTDTDYYNGLGGINTSLTSYIELIDTVA
jgi:hypothetical protein